MDKNSVKVITDDKQTTVDEMVEIKELEEKLVSMKADKDKKCKAAKEQLVDMLEVTIDKYKTATGTAEALRVLRFAYGDDYDSISTAASLAYSMALVAAAMFDKAKNLDYNKMDELCDSFYKKDFVEFMEDKPESEHGFWLAQEMMCIDLCRNVGGAAEDMVSFVKRVQDEIDATGERLKELKNG